MRSFLPILFLFCLILSSCINNHPSGADLQVGDRIPHFSVTMNNGEHISDTSLRGNSALIVFFHTSCSDCQKELPIIESLYLQLTSPSTLSAPSALSAPSHSGPSAPSLSGPSAPSAPSEQSAPSASSHLSLFTSHLSPFKLVCISRAQDESSIEEFWTENGLTMPFSPQPDRKVYELFASERIPRIYIVNAEGYITAAWDDSPLPTYSDLLSALSQN